MIFAQPSLGADLQESCWTPPPSCQSVVAHTECASLLSWPLGLFGVYWGRGFDLVQRCVAVGAHSATDTTRGELLPSKPFTTVCLELETPSRNGRNFFLVHSGEWSLSFFFFLFFVCLFVFAPIWRVEFPSKELQISPNSEEVQRLCLSCCIELWCKQKQWVKNQATSFHLHRFRKNRFSLGSEVSLAQICGFVLQTLGEYPPGVETWQREVVGRQWDTRGGCPIQVAFLMPTLVNSHLPSPVNSCYSVQRNEY